MYYIFRCIDTYMLSNSGIHLDGTFLIVLAENANIILNGISKRTFGIKFNSRMGKCSNPLHICHRKG